MLLKLSGDRGHTVRRRSGCTFDRVVNIHIAKAFLSEQVLIAILIVMLSFLHLHLIGDVLSDSCSAIPSLNFDNERLIHLSSSYEISVVLRL